MAIVFKLVTGTAAMSSLLLVLAGERDPPRPPAPVPDAIAVRWPPEDTAAPKADRLPLAAAAESIPAEVEAPVQVAAARTDVHQIVGATVSARRHAARDICQRHGMHKVIKRGGRSWRCRR